jgi:hypothetical protein
MTARWDNGRRVSRWWWQAVTAHGGARVQRCRWVRTPDGWDTEEGDCLAVQTGLGVIRRVFDPVAAEAIAEQFNQGESQ